MEEWDSYFFLTYLTITCFQRQWLGGWEMGISLAEKYVLDEYNDWLSQTHTCYDSITGCYGDALYLDSGWSIESVITPRNGKILVM